MALHNGLRGQRLAWMRILLVVVPYSLLFGYNQSLIGGVLSFASFTRLFPDINTSTTTGARKVENARVQGTVVAIYCLACLLGATFSAIAGNRLGRRLTVLCAACIACIGAILQAASFGLAQMIVGRLTSGVGVGALNATIPVWQAESTKAQSRGKSVVVQGIFVATGIAMASWIDLGFSYMEHDSAAWRIPMAIPIIFTIILICCLYLFPESPRWLVMKNRIEEGRAVLTVVADEPTDVESIERQLQFLQEAIRKDTIQERGWSDMLRMGPDKLVYRLGLAVAINFGAQITGANIISYYANTIFKESLQLPTREAGLLAAGLLTWKIVAASVSFLTVDRVGRKPLFITALLGMGTAMACLAGTVSDIKSQAASVAAVFFLFMYMAFFPLAFLGANFLLASEVGPQDLRVHYSAVGTATHWLFNFVVAEITPVAFSTIGWRYYIVYAVVAFAFVPLVYLCFPETKGRSLEELEEMFRCTAHWWQVPAAARNGYRSSTPTDDMAEAKEKDSEHIEG